jgi:GPI mannosyltransferase 2
MLVILISSSIWAIKSENGILRKLALPQLLLAVMAITSYHIQIITRLSSGCMVWYWWVAMQMCAKAKEEKGNKTKEERGKGKEMDWSQVVVRYMIVYAIVQGVLFAGFLPPA